MTTNHYLTKEGVEELTKKLQHLETVERFAISKQIGEAIEKGDISENAEYDAAKDAQGLLEAEIAKIKNLLANSRIIDASQINTSKVQILNQVTIKNLKTGATMKYKLVPENETDLKNGKISIKTPIAKGLIGKKIGDKVQITVPSGVMNFEIVDISI